MEKKKDDTHILKLLYFGILGSIIFLSVIVTFITGSFSSRIPMGERDIFFFSCGFILLVGSLIIPKILLKRSDDSQTTQLVTWACLEGVVTIGFIHSYMAKDNFILFYAVPALFQMFKSFPKRETVK